MPTVEFSMPPSDDTPAHVSTGYLEDTPEVREWLETLAIPRCQSWREANRELIPGKHDDAPCTERCYSAAPYCPSAYCVRCAGLRALNGEAALLPNEWMTK